MYIDLIDLLAFHYALYSSLLVIEQKHNHYWK